MTPCAVPLLFNHFWQFAFSTILQAPRCPYPYRLYHHLLVWCVFDSLYMQLDVNEIILNYCHCVLGFSLTWGSKNVFLKIPMYMWTRHWAFFIQCNIVLKKKTLDCGIHARGYQVTQAILPKVFADQVHPPDGTNSEVKCLKVLEKLHSTEC